MSIDVDRIIKAEIMRWSIGRKVRFHIHEHKSFGISEAQGVSEAQREVIIPLGKKMAKQALPAQPHSQPLLGYRFYDIAFWVDPIWVGFKCEMHRECDSGPDEENVSGPFIIDWLAPPEKTELSQARKKRRLVCRVIQV